MSTRAQIIELIHSEDDESLKQLHILLSEASNNPTLKLSSKQGTVQTKTIKVPSKWISPPNFSTDGTSSSSKVRSSSFSSTTNNNSQMKKPAVSNRELSPPTVRPQRTSKLEAAAIVSAAVAGTEDGRFCICGSLDDNDDETFIKCSIGKGGCNGWVHLSCSDLTENQKDDIILNKSKQQPKYVCSLCKEYVKNNRKVKRVSEVSNGEDEYEPPPELTISSRESSVSPKSSSGRSNKRGGGPIDLVIKKLKAQGSN